MTPAMGDDHVTEGGMSVGKFQYGYLAPSNATTHCLLREKLLM